MSLPMRGAWIEISSVKSNKTVADSRSPCGERGLKYQQSVQGLDGCMSLPMRGAWIEIYPGSVYCPERTVAPHAGSVD